MNPKQIVEKLLAPISENMNNNQVAQELSRIIGESSPEKVVVQNNMGSTELRVTEMWMENDTLHISVETPWV